MGPIPSPARILVRPGVQDIPGSTVQDIPNIPTQILQEVKYKNIISPLKILNDFVSASWRVSTPEGCSWSSPVLCISQTTRPSCRLLPPCHDQVSWTSQCQAGHRGLGFGATCHNTPAKSLKFSESVILARQIYAEVGKLKIQQNARKGKFPLHGETRAQAVSDNFPGAALVTFCRSVPQQ